MQITTPAACKRAAWETVLFGGVFLVKTILVLSLLLLETPFLLHAQDSVSIQENVQYGAPNGQKLLLDIYLPSGEDRRPPSRDRVDPRRRLDKFR